MSDISQIDHAAALLALLETTGLPVGDGAAPWNGPQKTYVAPSVVLHMIAGGTVDGTVGCPDEVVDARFQITAVGRNAAEARGVADRAAAVLAGGLSVPGRRVRRLRPMDPWSRIERDEDLQPPLFYAVRTYGLWTFPL